APTRPGPPHGASQSPSRVGRGGPLGHRGRPAACPPALCARLGPDRSEWVQGQAPHAGPGSTDAGSLGAGHRRSTRSGHEPGGPGVVCPCRVLYSYHFYVDSGVPQTQVLLWVYGERLRAVLDQVVLAEYHCHYDGRARKVTDIRDGIFYPTR